MPQSTEKAKQSVLMAGKMKDALGYKTPSVGKHETHKEVIKSLELLEHYMNMREE